MKTVNKILSIALFCICTVSIVYAQTPQELRIQMQEEGERAKKEAQGFAAPTQTQSGANAILRAGSLTDSPAPGSIHVNRNLAYRNYTPTQLVEEIFIKSGAASLVSNVRLRSHGWNGTAWIDSDMRGLGYFSQGTSNFEFAEGLVLSTGGLVSIEGPNSAVSAVAAVSNEQTIIPDAQLKDDDLQSLIGTDNKVTNVSVLEFDFVPTSSTIQFRYIFASEEYLSYANDLFNDVFGFFISGPGIPGGKQNIALLPSTTTGSSVVSINNVNWGKNLATVHNCATSTNTIGRKNPQYYINIPGYGWGDGGFGCENFTPTPAQEALRKSIEFNGRTVVLTATATVTPCQTYTLKLAVGNVKDYQYQSGVFLEAHSLDLGNIIENHGNGIKGMDNVYRGCTNNKFVISRPNIENTPLVVNLYYGGDAVNGTDISTYPGGGALPAQVTIPANQISVEVPYQVNTPPTGSKTFTITDNFCGQELAKVIHIFDSGNSQATASPACPGQNNGKITVTGTGGSGNYESSINGGTTWQSSLIDYTGLAAGNYTILTRDSSSCHINTHNVTIGTLSANAGSDQSLNGNIFTMAAQALNPSETGSWSVILGAATITDASSPTTTVTVNGSTATLRWTLNASGCQDFSDVVLTVIRSAKGYYVSVLGSGDKSGSDWENAMSNAIFSDALFTAVSGDTFYVAKGTYYPVLNNAGSNPANNNQKQYTLKNGVSIIGSYKDDLTGTQNDLIEYRDLTDNNGELKPSTIFSGELDNNNIIFDAKNATTGDTIHLNGIEICHASHAAIYAENVNLFLDFCLIDNNNVGSQGYINSIPASIVAVNNGSCEIRKSAIVNNANSRTSPIELSFADVIISNSLIAGNTSAYASAITYVAPEKTLKIYNSTISNNVTSNSIQGAIYASTGLVEIINSTIAGNTAGVSTYCAGIVLRNPDGSGGIGQESAVRGVLKLDNTILAGNGSADIALYMPDHNNPRPGSWAINTSYLGGNIYLLSEYQSYYPKYSIIGENKFYNGSAIATAVNFNVAQHLAALAYNGGFTKTRALVGINNFAYYGGNPVYAGTGSALYGLNKDQREVLRNVPNPSIGAFDIHKKIITHIITNRNITTSIKK